MIEFLAITPSLKSYSSLQIFNYDREKMNKPCDNYSPRSTRPDCYSDLICTRCGYDGQQHKSFQKVKTLPTAKEAARIVEEGQYAKAEREMEKITDLILKTIASGGRGINGEDYLDPAVIKQLRDKGYKYEAWSARNESGWNITW